MSFHPGSLWDCFPVPDAAGSARLEGAGMAKDFKFDVFLSHSSKDKAVVRPLAERLRWDGLDYSQSRFQPSAFGLSPDIS